MTSTTWCLALIITNLSFSFIFPSPFCHFPHPSLFLLKFFFPFHISCLVSLLWALYLLFLLIYIYKFLRSLDVPCAFVFLSLFLILSLPYSLPFFLLCFLHSRFIKVLNPHLFSFIYFPSVPSFSLPFPLPSLHILSFFYSAILSSALLGVILLTIPSFLPSFRLLFPLFIVFNLLFIFVPHLFLSIHSFSLFFSLLHVFNRSHSLSFFPFSSITPFLLNALFFSPCFSFSFLVSFPPSLFLLFLATLFLRVPHLYLIQSLVPFTFTHFLFHPSSPSSFSLPTPTYILSFFLSLPTFLPLHFLRCSLLPSLLPLQPFPPCCCFPYLPFLLFHLACL